MLQSSELCCSVVWQICTDVSVELSPVFDFTKKLASESFIRATRVTSRNTAIFSKVYINENAAQMK